MLIHLLYVSYKSESCTETEIEYVKDDYLNDETSFFPLQEGKLFYFLLIQR
jgi:hypothetical protein